MLRWKREQLAQRGISNALQQDGVPDLLRRILERPSRKFSGFIAAMFFGDQLVATEYFLRSGNLLHAWIRSYDADLSHFAPGHLLFWQTLQEAASQGVTRIDWGKGDESFKHRFTSCHTLVRSGWLDASPIRRAARHAAYHVSQSVALNNAVLNKALLQTKTFLAMDKIEMRGAS